MAFMHKSQNWQIHLVGILMATWISFTVEKHRSTQVSTIVTALYHLLFQPKPGHSARKRKKKLTLSYTLLQRGCLQCCGQKRNHIWSHTFLLCLFSVTKCLIFFGTQWLTSSKKEGTWFHFCSVTRWLKHTTGKWELVIQNLSD